MLIAGYFKVHQAADGWKTQLDDNFFHEVHVKTRDEVVTDGVKRKVMDEEEAHGRRGDDICTFWQLFCISSFMRLHETVCLYSELTRWRYHLRINGRNLEVNLKISACGSHGKSVYLWFNTLFFLR